MEATTAAGRGADKSRVDRDAERAAGGGVAAAAAWDAAEMGESVDESGGGEDERRSRTRPSESALRLLVDGVPPTSGALRVEVLLHRQRHRGARTA